MQTLKVVLIVIFWIDSILLVIAILLQSGRGGGLAGALGGISSADSALGVRAASQIEKFTAILAAVFLVTALILAYIATRSAGGGGPLELTGRSGVTTRPARAATSQPKSTTSGAATTSGAKATTTGAAAAAGPSATSVGGKTAPTTTPARTAP